MTLSASKSLSDMAKNRLRLTPFYSDILPVGCILPGSQIKAEFPRNHLVSNTIMSSQSRASLQLLRESNLI